jgi:DNA-binding XRE family transcriptional regulator
VIPNSTRRALPNRKLQALRINAGMSPNDLAYRAGVSGKTIRMVEAGHVPGPRIQFAIAAVFDKQPTELWPLHETRRHLVGGAR